MSWGISIKLDTTPNPISISHDDINPSFTPITELKNKAVKRYYLVDSRNKVEAAINSLPSPDEPDAAERFGEVERVLATAKRHLGDELHDQFSITLADMKPEYVG